MKTKTASVRLPKEMYQEIDNVCDGMSCSRNDWIKQTLKEKLVQEVKQESQGLKEPLESIEVPRIIVEDISNTVVTEISHQPTITFVD